MRRQPALQRVVLQISGWVAALGERTGLPLQRAATKVATAVRFPWYLRRLGPAEGTRVWWEFLFGTGKLNVSLPGYEHPIIVRLDGPDPTVFERIFVTDEYGDVESLGSCKAILDCGAYVGYSTLYFARHFPDAKIVAVEPDSENITMLRANTGHCPNVVAVQTALWSRRCSVRIKNESAMPWSFTVEEVDGEAPGALPATTIAHLVEDHALGAVDFLKIDIEGAELEVFKAGYESWLPGARMLIIELHDYLYPGSSESFFKATEGLPFDVEVSGENLILRACSSAR
jgi:FkbM family methyltransferase